MCRMCDVYEQSMAVLQNCWRWSSVGFVELVNPEKGASCKEDVVRQLFKAGSEAVSYAKFN